MFLKEYASATGTSFNAELLRWSVVLRSEMKHSVISRLRDLFDWAMRRIEGVR
jgi:hypothetical protein